MTKAWRKVLVLDTSAFICGFDPQFVLEEQFTAPLIREELMPGSMPYLRIKTAIESGKLKVKAPSQKFVWQVKEVSKNLGDIYFLPEADMQILAVALELKENRFYPIIVSDDYSVQNVASELGIPFASLVTFGIKYRFHWILYCPACYKKYTPKYGYKTCKICGTQLKRKALTRKLLGRS